MKYLIPKGVSHLLKSISSENYLIKGLRLFGGYGY
jgi:hypothetical protein